MLSNIFWVMMLVTAILLLLSSIVTLGHKLIINKLEKEIYQAKYEAIMSQCLLNIAKANRIVKEDK
jgi:succinate dehydrogenase hydrophobic anchor subunit